MYELYNKHYIRLDADSQIIKGFSSAFGQPQEDDICINDNGGYQFRLFLNSVENPLLRDIQGIYLYRYTNGEVIAKTSEEIQAEIAALPTPEPQLTPNDYTNIALAEIAEHQESAITDTQLALAELAEVLAEFAEAMMGGVQ